MSYGLQVCSDAEVGSSQSSYSCTPNFCSKIVCLKIRVSKFFWLQKKCFEVFCFKISVSKFLFDFLAGSFNHAGSFNLLASLNLLAVRSCWTRALSSPVFVSGSSSGVFLQAWFLVSTLVSGSSSGLWAWLQLWCLSPGLVSGSDSGFWLQFFATARFSIYGTFIHLSEPGPAPTTPTLPYLVHFGSRKSLLTIPSP